jgi:hypothetical protein
MSCCTMVRDLTWHIDIVAHQNNQLTLLVSGDYVSYIAPETKDSRRADWQKLNFAGTIDWAVDLQAFRYDEISVPLDIPPEGTEGCISGESDDPNTDDLCQFACGYGFCPENKCICTIRGSVIPLYPQVNNQEYLAWDEFDLDMQQLCKFSCQRGFCPADSCTVPVIDEWEDGTVDSIDQPSGGLWDKDNNYEVNRWQCQIFKTAKNRDVGRMQCLNNACKQVVADAVAEGRTTNYGCVGSFPLDQPIPWVPESGHDNPDSIYVMGHCNCDNGLVNILADTIVEALPIIAQIGCYIVMSAFKLVLDVGLSAIPGVGKALDAGMGRFTRYPSLNPLLMHMDFDSRRGRHGSPDRLVRISRRPRPEWCL